MKEESLLIDLMGPLVLVNIALIAQLLALQIMQQLKIGPRFEMQVETLGDQILNLRS